MEKHHPTLITPVRHVDDLCRGILCGTVSGGLFLYTEYTCFYIPNLCGVLFGGSGIFPLLIISVYVLQPLPGKQVTRYFDQHSEEFLDERQGALNTFLRRLTAHPYFSFDDNLKVFLTAETMVGVV